MIHLATVRYTQGLGNSALYVRLRDTTGQYYDWTNGVWSASETADCKLFLTEYSDADVLENRYQRQIDLPVFGYDTVLEYTKASDSVVIAEEEISGTGAVWTSNMGSLPTGGFPLAGDVVNQAAMELGLGYSADPFTDQNAIFIQLRALLTSVGKHLVHAREWKHLRKETSFTTVQGTSTYPLPNDFHNFYDQTWWNRTNRLPVGGPMSAQEWQYLKARLVGVVFQVLFRPMNRQIHLYPDTNTPGGFVIAYEYNSAWWVSQAIAPSTPSGDAPTASDDILWFDDMLLVRGLKLAYLKAKGFDTTYAQQDYNETLELVAGDDSPAPILNLTKQMTALREPLIGSQSLPITGYGT